MTIDSSDSSRGCLMQYGFDSIGHALDVAGREIGMHGEAQHTAGGALGVRKAARADSKLFAKRRKDRLQMESDRVMYGCWYPRLAHG